MAKKGLARASSNMPSRQDNSDKPSASTGRTANVDAILSRRGRWEQNKNGYLRMLKDEAMLEFFGRLFPHPIFLHRPGMPRTEETQIAERVFPRIVELIVKQKEAGLSCGEIAHFLSRMTITNDPDERDEEALPLEWDVLLLETAPTESGTLHIRVLPRPMDIAKALLVLGVVSKKDVDRVQQDELEKRKEYYRKKREASNTRYNEFRRMRTQAKKRDGGRCVLCYSKEKLQAHHILRFKDSDDNSVSNLVTLCGDCHRKIERPSFEIVLSYDVRRLKLPLTDFRSIWSQKRLGLSDRAELRTYFDVLAQRGWIVKGKIDRRDTETRLRRFYGSLEEIEEDLSRLPKTYGVLVFEITRNGGS